MRALVDDAGLAAELTLDSAGTGGWHVGELPDPRTRAAAARRGLSLEHRARQIGVADLDCFDLLVAMDRANLAVLERLARGRERPELRLLRSFDATAPAGAEVPGSVQRRRRRLRRGPRPVRARVSRLARLRARRARVSDWRGEVARALGAQVDDASPVAGGDIHDAYRVALADRRTIFVKANAAAPPDLFAAEAAGLAWLADAGALRVPRVLAIGGAWLALEWLDLDARVRGSRFAEQLGRGLARLHRAGAPSFGSDRISYVATIAQPIVAASTARELWIEHRLRPVCARAAALGHAPPLDARLDALAARPDCFGPAEPPARLHGDLWWGNVVAVADAPVVVDPAAYGGPREIDLAMLALFGELPDALDRRVRGDLSARGWLARAAAAVAALSARGSCRAVRRGLWRAARAVARRPRHRSSRAIHLRVGAVRAPPTSRSPETEIYSRSLS